MKAVSRIPRREELFHLTNKSVHSDDWDWYWLRSLDETHRGNRWAAARSRTAPTRGTRTVHDLGRFNNTAPVLPLELYDTWIPDSLPRTTILGFLKKELIEGMYYREYPPELRLTSIQPEGGRPLFVQETIPRVDREADYTGAMLGHTFASACIGITTVGRHGHPLSKRSPPNYKCIASSVDQDKHSRGWARYTTVDPAHRGRGHVVLLHVLIYECGAPSFRWSQMFRDYEARENLTQLGMVRAMLRGHALTILRAAHRGVDVPADVLASAHNWETIAGEIMATAQKRDDSSGRSFGFGPRTEEQQAKQVAKAERKKSRLATGRRSSPRRPATGGATALATAAEALTVDLNAAVESAKAAANDAVAMIDAAIDKAVDASRSLTAAIELATEATVAATKAAEAATAATEAATKAQGGGSRPPG